MVQEDKPGLGLFFSFVGLQIHFYSARDDRTMYLLKVKLRADEMAQCVKEVAAKPDDLSLTLRPIWWKGSQQVVLCGYTHTHTHPVAQLPFLFGIVCSSFLPAR